MTHTLDFFLKMIKTYRKCILFLLVPNIFLLIHGLTHFTPEDEQHMASFFNGDYLANEALKYNQQKSAIQSKIGSNYQAKTEPDLNTQLGNFKISLSAKLQDAITATENLATAAINSNRITSGEMLKCCKVNDVQHELSYSPFFKQNVNSEITCMTGSCRVARTLSLQERFMNMVAGSSRSGIDWSTGRVLSGSPSCDDFGLDVTFTNGCRENKQHREEGGAWQYFGAESGAYTIYPAHQQDCAGAEQYDPRFRPWYINALVPEALDVVLIIDKSGSMWNDGRMNLVKEASKIVINMLRPYDRIAVAPFSSDDPYNPDEYFDEDNVNCFGHKLAMATQENKEKLIDAVSKIEHGGTTYYSRALRYARAFLDESDSPPGGDDVRLRGRI